MCLITTQKEAKITIEDTICFKVLKYDLKSPYERFQYELNKLYQTEIKEEINGWSTFDTEDCKYLNLNYPDWSDGERKDLLCFAEGFHSASTIKRLENCYKAADEIVFKCTIPKGSEYYENPTGLLVSNQIIINHKI